MIKVLANTTPVTTLQIKKRIRSTCEIPQIYTVLYVKIPQ